jgi:putative oxidoreductase
MVVAYFIAHANDSFQVKNLAFVFLCLCPVVYVLGSGRFSIDQLIFRKK